MKSSDLNYLDIKLKVLESNIPYESKAVRTGLDKKFNS